MTAPAQTLPTKLEWRQNDMWTRYWQLVGGDAVYAELRFQSAFGSLAHAATGDGRRWSFKRNGFFSTHVSARLIDSTDGDVATYRPHWGGTKGTLTVGDETLQLASTKFWGGAWALSMSNGTPLIAFENKGILRQGAEVRITDAGHARTDLALLLSLGWYALVLHMEDSAAAAAGAC